MLINSTKSRHPMTFSFVKTWSSLIFRYFGLSDGKSNWQPKKCSFPVVSLETQPDEEIGIRLKSATISKRSERARRIPSTGASATHQDDRIQALMYKKNKMGTGPFSLGRTSLWGSPRAICSWSSFCSSLRAPIDSWLRAKSASSLRPASVKYLEKCSALRLLAGNSSWG